MTTTPAALPEVVPAARGGFPDWGTAAAEANSAVVDSAVCAFWRALNYLSAAQLYLLDNVRLARELRPADVKPEPRGHWGVCPPVNYVLAHLAR